MQAEYRWMRAVLACAGLCNLMLGTLLAMNVPASAYAGTMVVAFGLAFGCAAIDPVRHWPVTLAGLVGKVLGPLVVMQALPWRFGWALVANDVIWWAPFAMILRGAWRWFRDEPDRVHVPAWQRARTETGEALGELSFQTPVLLVALRHSGCTFCREALATLAETRGEIESSGLKIVLAHLGTPGAGAAMAARYELEDVDRVADPNRLLYRAVGLRRGTLGQLFGPRVWWRGFVAGVLGRHGIRLTSDDMFQMGGVFLLDKGRIAREFRYQDVADRPDFVSLSH